MARLSVLVAILLAFAIQLRGAAAEDVPPITAQLVSAMGSGAWETIEPGLAYRMTGASGVRITAIRVDAKRFRFSLAVQDGNDGERVESFAERASAVLAINGGFFGEQSPGKGLFPVGLLRLDGRNLSRPWTKSGGYLRFIDGTLSVLPTGEGPPQSDGDLLQSRPVLIEPGGAWAMNTNSANLRRRSLVCIRPDDQVILLIVGGAGLSLFEAGWLFRAREEGGFFGCDSAIALDGGGSTQLWVGSVNALAVRGDTPVHNAILVSRR